MVDPGRVSPRIAPVDKTEVSTDSVDTPSQPNELDGSEDSTESRAQGWPGDANA
ncbi:hypothetical protein ABH930_001517 [Kitasatospora sp. GAS204A]|nr:hypothetical protein [Kitasatospora sp. GAS204B]